MCATLRWIPSTKLMVALVRGLIFSGYYFEHGVDVKFHASQICRRYIEKMFLKMLTYSNIYINRLINMTVLITSN